MWYNVWLIPDCAIDWPTTQQLQVRAELSEGQPRARWIRQTPEAVGRVFWCIVTTLSLITSYVQLSLLAMCISNVLYSWWVWTLLVSYELVTCTYPPLHLNVIKIQTVFVVIKINIASVFTADVYQQVWFSRKWRRGTQSLQPYGFICAFTGSVS